MLHGERILYERLLSSLESMILRLGTVRTARLKNPYMATLSSTTPRICSQYPIINWIPVRKQLDYHAVLVPRVTNQTQKTYLPGASHTVFDQRCLKDRLCRWWCRFPVAVKIYAHAYLPA
ncbi:hypothetical protein LXL04_006709 [Taraxacum kok-saghyz]